MNITMTTDASNMLQTPSKAANLMVGTTTVTPCK